MTLELLVIVILLAGGVPIAVAAGVRGPAVLAAGLMLGSAAVVTTGALLVVVGLVVPVWLVLSITAVLGVVVGWRDRANIVPVVRQIPVVVTFGSSLVLVTVLWQWGAVNLTPDSYRYVTTGALIANGKLGEATGSLLLTRGLAVPLLHSPANLIGELHLRSLSPLFAIATVGVLVWAINVGLRDSATQPRTIVAVQVVAAVMLVSINRFVFHAFYVNGHLFIAGWMLLLASSIWVGTTRSQSPATVTVGRCLVVIAIALARPDGVLLAGLVLVPLLPQRSLPVWERSVPLVALGAVTLSWNLTIGRAFPAESGIPLEVRALIAVGAVLIVGSIILLAWPYLLPKRLGPMAEVALWATVVAASVRRPDILKGSIRATLDNVLLDEGGWGISLGVLGVLVVIVLIASIDPSRSALRFPVTAFVPLSILLAFLREGAYRVGPGDSLNRMLIQIVPLVVLLLASAVVAPRWRWLEAIVSDTESEAPNSQCDCHAV